MNLGVTSLCVHTTCTGPDQTTSDNQHQQKPIKVNALKPKPSHRCVKQVFHFILLQYRWLCGCMVVRVGGVYVGVVHYARFFALHLSMP